MNSKWRVAKCPYCGHYNYYKSIGASNLNKMSEHLKIDMTWDGTIHCAREDVFFFDSQVSISDHKDIPQLLWINI